MLRSTMMNRNINRFLGHAVNSKISGTSNTENKEICFDSCEELGSPPRILSSEPGFNYGYNLRAISWLIDHGDLEMLKKYQEFDTEYITDYFMCSFGCTEEDYEFKDVLYFGRDEQLKEFVDYFGE